MAGNLLCNKRSVIEEIPNGKQEMGELGNGKRNDRTQLLKINFWLHHLIDEQ